MKTTIETTAGLTQDEAAALNAAATGCRIAETLEGVYAELRAWFPQWVVYRLTDNHVAMHRSVDGPRVLVVSGDPTKSGGCNCCLARGDWHTMLVATRADGTLKHEQWCSAAPVLPQQDSERALINNGYVRNPNESIHGLPGSGWYPGSSGLLEPVFGQEIRVLEDGRFAVVGRYSSRGSVVEGGIVVKTVGTLGELLVWLRDNGKVSEPGLGAYANGWD